MVTTEARNVVGGTGAWISIVGSLKKNRPGKCGLILLEDISQGQAPQM